MRDLLLRTSKTVSGENVFHVLFLVRGFFHYRLVFDPHQSVTPDLALPTAEASIARFRCCLAGKKKNAEASVGVTSACALVSLRSLLHKWLLLSTTHDAFGVFSPHSKENFSFLVILFVTITMFTDC